MSQTPVRRSTRLASNNGSVAASVAPSVPASARSARRKTAGPLPKLKVTQSHAYGATGTFNPANDVDVPVTGFAQAFESKRTTAVIRDESVAPSKSPSTPSERSQGSSRSQTPTSVHSSSIIVDRSPSIDISKSFGIGHEAGMLRNTYTTRETNSTINVAAASFRDRSVPPRPAPLKPAAPVKPPTLPSRAPALINGLHVPTKASTPTKPPTSIRPPASINVPPPVRAPPPIRPTIPAKAPIGGEHSSTEPRLPAVRNFLRMLRRNVMSILNAFALLTFFVAFLSLLYMLIFRPATLISYRNKVIGSSGLEHLQNHSAIHESINLVDLESRLDRKYQSLYQTIVSEMDQKIHQKSSQLSKDVADVRKGTTNLATRIKEIVASHVPHGNVEAIAREFSRHVNYFSTSFGAYVDPYRTSPTYKPRKQPEPRSLSGMLFGRTDPLLPPVTALRPWEEPGDRWCAAPSSDKGLAQISIVLGQIIHPQKLYIENIHKQATLDPGAAPKHMELWVAVPDPRDRKNIFGKDHWVGGKCSAPDGLDDDYVCIRRFVYDLEANNPIQKFDIDLDMKRLNIGVGRFVVRVVENWGEAYTCLYRLRLEGELVADQE